MGIFNPPLDTLFVEARKASTELLSAWITESSCKALLPLWQDLDRKVDKLMAALPRVLRSHSSLSRHVHFVGLYLKKGDKKSCTGDVQQIACDDLPSIESQWVGINSSVLSIGKLPADFLLLGASQDLLETGKYDDAIRQAFLRLSERLRKLKRGIRERDGVRLVDELFADNGKAAPYMDHPTRRSVRDLLAGLYTLFRNKYAHTTSRATITEAMGVVMTIHYVLLICEKIKKAKRRAP